MNIEEGIIKAKTILNNHREIDKMMVIEMVELVEILLTAYEKEKEKNKSIVYNYEIVVDKLENSTPNDKIKAKIEGLIKEGNYRTADNPNGRVHFQKEITDYQIEVLQSLLEKE